MMMVMMIMMEEVVESSSVVQPLAGNNAEANGEEAQMMHEIERFREIPLWTDLIWYIGTQVKGNVRHCLSYHMTTACRPRKQTGPAPSLNESGLDVELGERGNIYVRLESDALYEAGDGIRLDYRSDTHSSLEEAQRQTCIDILAFMLVSGPKHVRLHPNQWLGGLAAIDTLRTMAARIQATRPPAPGSGRGATVASRMLSVEPAPVPTSLRAERAAAFTPATDEGEERRRERAVLDAFLTLARDKWYWSGKMPGPLWPVLKDSIPEGSLRKFLQDHPWHFEVAPPEAGRKGVWFKVKHSAGRW